MSMTSFILGVTVTTAFVQAPVSEVALDPQADTPLQSEIIVEEPASKRERRNELRHLKSYERIRVLEEDDPVRAWTYRPARLPGPVAVPTSQGSAGDRLAFADGPSQSYYASRLRMKMRQRN